MSFRNRCVVAGANGPILLSIPLEQGRNQRTIMKDVRIANRQNWQRHHWTTIISCYNRSPWFEFYRDGFGELYQRRVEFLLEWNLLCFDLVARCLKQPLEVALTPFYQPVYDPEEFLDWRDHLLPSTIHQVFPEPVRYRQVFEEKQGFIPHLSILDLLCCAGTGAGAVLQGK